MPSDCCEQPLPAREFVLSREIRIILNCCYLATHRGETGLAQVTIVARGLRKKAERRRAWSLNH
jgi:hypothetical protein